MEDWWEDWFSDLDMNGDDSFNQCQTNEEHRRQQQATVFSSSCPYNDVVCSSMNFFEPRKGSLMNSENNHNHHHHHLISFEGSRRNNKRARSSWETQDHIMSERKRRQQMAERFVALSAIIPGLKKIDKASVLREAINYVKQLKERIAVLEQEGKRKSATSTISIRKSQTHPRETNSTNAYLESNQVLPEVEAIGIESENELLIRIHCEKRQGILIKLLALLENMHLSIASTSVLPFGNNTLNITIIAQMGEEYSVTEEELVENLRQDLFKLYDMQL